MDDSADGPAAGTADKAKDGVATFVAAPPPRRHKYSDLLDRQLAQCAELADEGLDGWQHVVKDDVINVHRRDVLVDGALHDRTRVTGMYSGVSAAEVCRFFFDPEHRLEWESEARACQRACM